MTKLFKHWSKKQRAQHEAKKAIVKAALESLETGDTRGVVIAARMLKKAKGK